MQGQDGWAIRQQIVASAAGISAHDCPDHCVQWSYCPGSWLDVTLACNCTTHVMEDLMLIALPKVHTARMAMEPHKIESQPHIMQLGPSLQP